MPPLLLALTALALCWILLPFYGAILWALIIAVLFVPVYRRLLPHLKPRRNLAAAPVMLLVLGIGSGTFDFVASLGVALYLAFFLIRDGDSLARIAEMTLPVPQQFKRELLTKFMAALRATVKGSLLIAGIQGMLGGIAFWYLGVSGALLWAFVMAVLSLLPLIGAALVWLPVAGYLLVTGQAWQSLALVAYGVFVICLADNLGLGARHA